MNRQAEYTRYSKSLLGIVSRSQQALDEETVNQISRVVAASQPEATRAPKAVWIQGPRYWDRGAATAEAAPAVSHSLFWARTLENTPE